MSDDNSFQDTEESDSCPVFKRTHHNMLERQRRDNIKDSFDNLKQSLPTYKGKKVRASRAQILKKAVDFIRVTRQRQEAHQTDIMDLRRENHMLEGQIRSMQNKVSSGQNNQDAAPGISKRLASSEPHETSSTTSTDSSGSTEVVHAFQPPLKRFKSRSVNRKQVKRFKNNAKH